MDPWAIWLGIALVLAMAEMFTMTAALGLLAGGALVAGLGAGLGLSLPAQLLLFAVSSAVGVLVVRPRVARSAPGGVCFGTDSLPGRVAVVTAAVTDRGGRVLIGGEEWTARALCAGPAIGPGETVDVVHIDGATAVVLQRG